jgi:hypothetical protein
MVEGLNKALAAPEHENFAVKSGRVFTRAVANSILAITALIETVISGALTVLTSPLAISRHTKPAFDWAKKHTVAAGGAVKNAAAGIIGKAGTTPKPAPIDTQNPKEEINPKHKNSTCFSCSKVIAAGAAGALLFAAYKFYR